MFCKHRRYRGRTTTASVEVPHINSCPLACNKIKIIARSEACNANRTGIKLDVVLNDNFFGSFIACNSGYCGLKLLFVFSFLVADGAS